MDGWITHPTPGRGGYGNPPTKLRSFVGAGKNDSSPFKMPFIVVITPFITSIGI